LLSLNQSHFLSLFYGPLENILYALKMRINDSIKPDKKEYIRNFHATAMNPTFNNKHISQDLETGKTASQQ